MTLNTILNRKTLIACLSMLFVISAGISQTANAGKSKHGYPACLYFYENAGKQKIKSERSCFTLGGHGSKAMGGGDKDFSKLSKVVRAFGKPVQYVDLKKGYTIELHYKGTKSTTKKMTLTKDGAIDIRRNALKGVRIWKTSEGRGGYPVCLYESNASLKKKKTKHAICLPYGEYRNLEAYGWDNKAKYIDLNSKYKAYLYRDEDFNGTSAIMEKDGKIRMEGKNKSVTSIRIEKK